VLDGPTPNFLVIWSYCGRWRITGKSRNLMFFFTCCRRCLLISAPKQLVFSSFCSLLFNLHWLYVLRLHGQN
jgi:hypothetical protein